MAKFGAATTPMPRARGLCPHRLFMRLPASRPDDHAGAARRPASAASPERRRQPKNRWPRRRAGQRSGVAGVRAIDDPGDVHAVLARQRLDEPAHPAVADEQQPRCSPPTVSVARRPRSAAARRTDRGAASSPRERPRRAARPSRSAARRPATPCAAGTLPARRACARRSAGRAAGRRRRRTGWPCRARPAPRRTPRGSSMTAFKPPVVVDRHRHADLGRRDDVHGRAVALEHLEDAAEVAVGHQHPRRGDVDDGDVALAGDRREPSVRSSSAPRDAISVPGAAARRLLQDADRDVARDRRQNRARMQHLRAEVRELRGLAERQRPGRRAARRRRADRRSACRRRRSRSGSRARSARRR